MPLSAHDVAELQALVEHLPVILLTPMFFGIVLATALFGIVSLQVYHYFTRYSNDTRSDKLFVGLIWFLEAIHLSTSLYITYHLLVSAWDQPFILLDPTLFKVIQHQIALMIAMVVCSHSLYGLMAWKLSCHAHWLVSCIIIGLIIAGHGIDIFATVEIYKIDPKKGIELVLSFTTAFGPTVLYPAFSSAMVVDTILASFLCYILRQSCAELSVSNSLPSRAGQYFIASGLLVSTLQVAIFVTCLALPNSFVFFALEVMLPGVHAISYLALMNTRKVLRHGIGCTVAPNMPLTVHIHTLIETSTAEKLPAWTNMRGDAKAKLNTHLVESSSTSSVRTVIEM